MRISWKWLTYAIIFFVIFGFNPKTMLKKTFNICFILLFVSLIAFTNGCSGDSTSESTSDTTFLESGVKFIYLEKGNGQKIDSLSHVSAHINLIVEQDTVWSTYDDGEQIFEFDAKRTSLIPGFDEVVMYAREGDRVLAIIPPELGYGERGAGDDIPPNSTLQFDLNMIEVEAPRIFISDVLHTIYLEKGVDEMIASYEALEVESTTHNFEISEWYDLSNRMMQAGQHQDAVTLWNFKLTEASTLQSYFMKASAHERLGELENAVNTLSKGLEVATDTTGYGFVKGYLAELKAR